MRKKAAFAAVAILAALAGLIYETYRRDLAEARARASVGSRLAQTACGAIEYSSFGDGPAVLLVHGGGGGIDQVLADVRAFLRRD